MTYLCRGCNERHSGNNPALSIEIDPTAEMGGDENYDWCVPCADALLDKIRAWVAANSNTGDCLDRPWPSSASRDS